MPILHSLKARVLASLAGIGSLAAAASVALYGAYGKIHRASEPVYKADAAIQTGQWQVVPRRAWTTESRIYGVPVASGSAALVLEAELTNRTAESSADYLGLLRWNAPPGAPAGARPMVVNVRDALQMPYLQPGLPERVAFIWTLPAAATPTSAAFAVQSKTYKPVDNLYGAPGWFNPVMIGRVELPVVRGGEPEPGS